MSVLHSMVPGNKYSIQMLWVCVNQVWGPMCEPSWCDFKALCVCVFHQEMFLSYTAQVNWELSKHFSSARHAGYILLDSFLNSAIPQVWLIFISSDGDGTEKNGPSS